MTKATLLIELGSEELPPKNLKTLAQAFASHIATELKSHGFEFGACQSYATPRRLAVALTELSQSAKAQSIERFGPQWAVAFHADGSPTPAALGFARSCNVDIKAIGKKSDGKAEKLYFCQQQAGANLADVIQSVLDNALAALPIAKKMRWGANDFGFVRPVKWLLALYGADVLACSAFGLQADRLTRGHRFHHPEAISLDHADHYASALEKAWVIADFHSRQQQIVEQIQQIVHTLPAGSEALIPAALLEEVCALVEYPQAVLCGFAREYLNVPKEALIATMQDNQKYFALVSANGDLLPQFITIANIKSLDERALIRGNERVISPRLADAEFFYQQDLQTGLEAQLPRLAHVVFEQQLGSLLAKTERLQQLAPAIAELLDSDRAWALRAASLCKVDLLSNMVNEFASMQGIAGKYYALAAGEPPEVAAAIEQHYLPRHASDALPDNGTSITLALADKLDTLIGIWAAGLQPTGSKDPYALRRTALGIIKILAEKKLDLALDKLIEMTAAVYENTALPLKVASYKDAILNFCIERLRGYVVEQGYSAMQFAAVVATSCSSPHDFMLRLKALAEFATLEAAPLLANANKRCANILDKTRAEGIQLTHYQSELADNIAERELACGLDEVAQRHNELIAKRDYSGALLQLSQLAELIDRFFNEVMVMCDDLQQRHNRLALLAKLRSLYSQVADLSLLS